MRIFLRLYAVGCVLIFLVSCQAKVRSALPEAIPEMLPLHILFSQLEARQSGIRNIKASIRTKISGHFLNQSFRQDLFLRGNEAIRLETYNLFRQILGVLIYNGDKTLMYVPAKNRIIHGDAVWNTMHQITGSTLDFRKYLSVFSGGIPRLSYLRAKSSQWNVDQTAYWVEAVDQETGEQMKIEIDAYTQLPKSILLIQDAQEVYKVCWRDYRKVDQWDFAHKVVIEFKAKNEVVTVRYSDLFINQRFTPDAFEFLPKLKNK